MKTGIAVLVAGLLATAPMIAAAQQQQVTQAPVQSAGTASGGETSGTVNGLGLLPLVAGLVAVGIVAIVAANVADNTNNNAATTTTN